MNYYERHLGDYARDAGHLTMIEHGAYTLLLDRYYTTEQGIPADQAHRVCRARTREEKEAVDTVLAEFFTLTDGVWVNGRATREVTKTQAKVKAAQENGKRGGRPKQTEEKPSGFLPGSDSVTQTKALQSPDTSNQEKTKTARKRAAPAVLVSVDDMVAEGVDRQHAIDWMANRKAKGLPLTPTAWADTQAEAAKAGLTLPQAIKTAAGNAWGGFKASWLQRDGGGRMNGSAPGGLDLDGVH